VDASPENQPPERRGESGFARSFMEPMIDKQIAQYQEKLLARSNIFFFLSLL
jgi:hypothetical protein